MKKTTIATLLILVPSVLFGTPHIVSNTVIGSFLAGAVMVDNSGNVWAGRSSDRALMKYSGGSWTSKYTFSKGTYVRMIWQASNGYIYAGCDGYGKLIRSTDGGENWTDVLTLHSATYSTSWHMDEDSSGNLYYAEYSNGAGQTEGLAYIMKSVDGGANWTTVYSPASSNERHTHFVAVDPYTDYIYAAIGENPYSKVIRSTNGGTSWTTLWSGTWEDYPTTVIFFDGMRMFGNDAVGPQLGVTGHDFWSTSDDTTRTFLRETPATDPCFWLLRNNSRGIIVAASWSQGNGTIASIGQILASDDQGATWHQLLSTSRSTTNAGYFGVSEISSDGIIYVSDSENSVVRKLVIASYTLGPGYSGTASWH